LGPSSFGVLPMKDVTCILSAVEHGDSHAAAELLPLVYQELRKLAAQRLAQESPGQTLQPTALVHEAYLRLGDCEEAQHWDSRGHFFAAAAEAMRRILVENARHKHSQKAGNGRQRRPLDDLEATVGAPPDDLLALDEALTKLGRENQPAAELAKLRLFTGQTVEEAADALRVSRRTGFRLWTYGRAFLQAELSSHDASARA